ncbi:mucin-6-like [Oppia nitens]|uniref:mucin-6-like n=1 Tax=Oppia nitens TaxID=1686743 RepID=UPI0023DCE96C|nr:mucin-6-like [Oppia nitens]
MIKLLQLLLFILYFNMINMIDTISLCNEPNTEWKVRGTNCGRFCADLQTDKVIECPEWRNTIGCFCKEGYYRNKDLKCVNPDECGQGLKGQSNVVPVKQDDSNATNSRIPTNNPEIVCPVNEIYDNCSSRCLEHCDRQKDPIACPIKCDEGCFCKGSRLRSREGKCVLMQECEGYDSKDKWVDDIKKQKQCPFGEVFEECSDRCKEMCPSVKDSFGRVLSCTRCEPGCFCIDGYMRTKDGNCVDHRKCERKGVVYKVISSILNVILPKWSQ